MATPQRPSVPSRSNRERSLGRAPRRPGSLVFLLALVVTLLASCVPSGVRIPGNLLGGKQPSRVAEVTEPSRLTDGVVARAGDHWESDVTSVLRGGLATVEWDLGSVVHVRAFYLQGDNNDEFFLAGSEDGQSYRDLWTAGTVQTAGMQARSVRDVDHAVRYLRLTAKGGDPAVSVGEVAAFESPPSPWPPEFRVKSGGRSKLPGETETLLFGLVAGLVLVLHGQRWPGWARVGGVVVALAFAYNALEAVVSAWPPGQPVIDMARAVAAAVAAAAALRVGFHAEEAMPRVVNAALAAMAFLAMTTFYNMWQPQFDDVENRGHTWIHTWDMRVYFPTAKYFDELGYDGLYVASVAAYLEDAPGASEARLARTELRDLRTYDMTTVAQVSGEIHGISKRFSPERWTEFKRDMSYFWKTMGPGGYLGSLRDHGGNATPAWMFVAYLMFKNVTATATSLGWAAALDPLLLLAFFYVAWETFGLRAALVCLVVYGTSTFPWFGSNWAGSTLRNDWMVLVGLGACALRKERWATGGALLAWAAMIRAFPAVSVFFLIAPALWWVWEERKKRGSLPPLRELLVAQRPLVRALAGALGCVLVLFLLSGARFGFSHAWGDWARKIGMHAVQPNINHVGLRTLFQYDPSRTLRALSHGGGGDWAMLQLKTLHGRRFLYFLAIGAITALAFAATRRRDLRQAALIGMMMIPIYFYASNYYLHYVFVLPLLVDYPKESGEGKMPWTLISVVLLAVSVSEYWGFDAGGVDERYAHWSWTLLVGYVVILAALARDAWPEWSQKKAEQAPAPA